MGREVTVLLCTRLYTRSNSRIQFRIPIDSKFGSGTKLPFNDWRQLVDSRARREYLGTAIRILHVVRQR